MDTLIKIPPVSLKLAKDSLKAQLKMLRPNVNVKAPGIWRLTVNVKPVLILEWLAQQKQDKLIFWSDRHDLNKIGGVGVAHELNVADGNKEQVFRNIQSLLLKAPSGLRYFGGFAFDGEKLDPNWQEFGTKQFWIPRFELLQTSEESMLVCNLIINGDINQAFEKVEEDLSDLITIEKGFPLEVPGRKDRQDFPTQTAWQDIMNKALASINQKQYEKIVLARKTLLTLERETNAFQLLKKLEDSTDQCFHFCFQMKPGVAFFGASPERLYWRRNDFIKSEAIAGTRPRGKDIESDQALMQELMTSRKDLTEHNYVAHFIKNSFKELCFRFTTSNNVELLKLKEGMHLFSDFEGHVHENVNDESILKILHPTPAVAGFSVVNSVNALRTLEPFSRGWYAGAVGYIGGDETQFVVAIRSALLRHEQLALFAGAGIVKGSTAQAEWQEIENKLNSFWKIWQ